MGNALCNKGLPITIIQGSDTNVDIFLVDETTGRPYPLQTVTGATATFPAAVGGALAASAILISQDLAHFQAQLSQIVTPQILTGENQDMQIAVDQGSIRTIAQALGLLNVVPQLFQD